MRPKISKYALARISKRWPTKHRPKSLKKFLLNVVQCGENFGFLDEKCSLRYFTPITVLFDETKSIIVTAVLGRKNKEEWTKECNG